MRVWSPFPIYASSNSTMSRRKVARTGFKVQTDWIVRHPHRCNPCGGGQPPSVSNHRADVEAHLRPTAHGRRMGLGSRLHPLGTWRSSSTRRCPASGWRETGRHRGRARGPLMSPTATVPRCTSLTASRRDLPRSLAKFSRTEVSGARRHGVIVRPLEGSCRSIAGAVVGQPSDRSFRATPSDPRYGLRCRL